MDALVAIIWSIGLILSIAFTLILFKGISERNPVKVSYYKIFTIAFLFIFSIDSIYTVLSGKSTGKQEVAVAMITILFTIYEIVVIYSLEMMYREESPLPLTQPDVNYQMYPPQQPILNTQPEFKHPTAPYINNPHS